MSKKGIPYFDKNWNITHGCSKVSAGCQHCWMEVMAKRLAGKGIRGYDATCPTKPTFCPWLLDVPSKTKKPTIFGVSFMGDLFHPDITDQQRGEVFATMIAHPEHKFILLTKRPEIMIHSATMVKNLYFTSKPSDHIWFGCSVEDNQSLAIRTPWMSLIHELGLHTWLSIEPLLEDISFDLALHTLEYYYDGIIVGGESGPSARYCDPYWIGNIYELCKQNNIPFYFKQWGTNKDNVDDGFEFIPIQTTKQLPWR